MTPSKFRDPVLCLVAIAAIFLLWTEYRILLDKEKSHQTFTDNESMMGDVTMVTHYEAETPENTSIMDDYLYFRYIPPTQCGNTTVGERFKVPSDIAKDTLDLSKNFVNLTLQNAHRFVFAMAASWNHFGECKDAVASAQFHFPGYSIYFYDLGLNDSQVAEVQTWRDVHLRRFDFSPYPAFFTANLRQCVWKPFIIKAILQESPGVFWMDASVRLHSSDFPRLVYPRLIHSGGMVMFKPMAHTNYAATHPRTYDFLPTDRESQKDVLMSCAAAMFIFNTREMFSNVLLWWFLCAYEEQCQTPMEKTYCTFPNKTRAARTRTFANCHKWDQSTINVLLSNYHGYATDVYGIPEKDMVVTVERWPTNYYILRTVP